ncbi:MAG: hypothetical protein H6765_10020 [Candidatus Peribacteria bacterium]|nr:MAG: hypothetical protein H6765_10020 [Candidatus Peribacteria bacterium]
MDQAQLGSGMQQLTQPEDLEEFRQRMENYIPEERNEHMLQQIQRKSDIWRKNAVQQVDEE